MNNWLAGEKMSSKGISENFSTALGLFDYINPIFYSVTSITIAVNMYSVMPIYVFFAYLFGAVISLIFGLTIPTVKLMVGLGKMKFSMPVNLVFYVNSGIFLSGLMLFDAVIRPSVLMLALIAIVIVGLLFVVYCKKRKFNTVAVLTGAFGYMMIYLSMITYSLRGGMILPVVLYVMAILLFVSLCCIGIKANLKDARVHWVIEICNVVCQMLVATATVVVFLL
ncbi:MAG: hypothetical protein MJ153_09225 [Clostridia bacterium]|nr:hypothetical protein [Clostridia bacterium]